jgi:hypothetical protein
MIEKKKIFILDRVILAVIFLSFAFMRPDYIIAIAYLLTIPYLFFTNRKKAFYHLMVASIVAIVWMLIAKDQYSYNKDMLNIGGIVIFPLFAWALGLFGAYLIYSHWEEKFDNTFHKFLFFVALYWPILLLFDGVAYHIFNIKNIATAAYSGLKICDCIHAPFWMQTSYLALGPIYFATCKLLKLKNPNE